MSRIPCCLVDSLLLNRTVQYMNLKEVINGTNKAVRKYFCHLWFEDFNSFNTRLSEIRVQWLWAYYSNKGEVKAYKQFVRISFHGHMHAMFHLLSCSRHIKYFMNGMWKDRLCIIGLMSAFDWNMLFVKINRLV